MMRRFGLLGAVLGAFLLPLFAGAAEEIPPVKVTKSFLGEADVVRQRMEALFEASKKVNGPEKRSAREAVEAAMDWKRIARACLGESQWKKQSAKNRAEFRELLRQVVVRTAYSRMDKFWADTTGFRFDRIDVKGSEAHVTANFTLSGDKFALDYYLAKRGKSWVIYDISFEDIRYSENIRDQITSFLKEKPFSQLLVNLKKRRDELGETPSQGAQRSS